ncbi:MAG: hypothetical protein E3J81_10340 [Dehalococcoidia bacterium]|nr:MAG: hypothetical protein E3J81_10340 [Dehalococcoidia bacterium]
MVAFVRGKWLIFLAVVLLVLASLILASCAAGTSKGTISGTVTNSLTGGPLIGATLTTDPAIEGVDIETDDSGSYSASLPVGIYTLTFEKQYFESYTETVSVVALEPASQHVALAPTSPVAVDAGEDEEGSPGGTATLKATAEPLDGSTVSGYEWSQTAGVAATIQNANSATPTVTLGDPAAYKAELFDHLDTLDRFMVQAVNPHSLEEAEAATFTVTVTTSSGTYSDTVDVTVDLTYVVNTGIRNVPIGLPVLLHGKIQDAYSWTLTSPSGSGAALDDSSLQNPAFTPDIAGKYILTEANSGATLDIYTGTWTGVITGQDASGQPVADAACTMCHDGSIAPDKFSPWAASGHAEILTQNIDDPQGHWSLGCASCHTVGYDTDADNNGFDEAVAAEGWEVPHGAVGNWANMLANYPDTAGLANIQCENCHGPQQSEAHMQSSPRTSISSDVCGACHGEPLRHGRFQQWEESKHADYTLAVERGTSSHCGRCHSGQGFLEWLPQLEAGNPGNIETEITWTAETVHPTTCVVCHEPHEQGKISGEPNTATVRIEGNTPLLPAGFKALGVGRGALCMTCHNTRNGAHNDAVTTTMDDHAPHVAAQADLLMGENAFFVTVGERSPHSYIEDSCTNCHMQLTPPPAELSYNLSGTNHTFEASLEICSSCHGVFDGGSLQEAIEGQLEELKTAIEQAITDEIAAQTTGRGTVTLVGVAADGSDVVITGAGAVTAVELTESHGRIAMDITVNGTTYEHVRLASDTAVGAGTLVDSAAGQTIVKAAWNYFLIHGDGSNGVHNPSFANRVLNASIDALK